MQVRAALRIVARLRDVPHAAATAKLKANDVDAWSNLLQLCSHYDPSSRPLNSHAHRSDDLAESRVSKLLQAKEVSSRLSAPSFTPQHHSSCVSAPTSFIVFIRNCWSGSTPVAAPALCSATQSGDPSSSSTTRSECR